MGNIIGTMLLMALTNPKKRKKKKIKEPRINYWGPQMES